MRFYLGVLAFPLIFAFALAVIGAAFAIVVAIVGAIAAKPGLLPTLILLCGCGIILATIVWLGWQQDTEGTEADQVHDGWPNRHFTVNATTYHPIHYGEPRATTTN
jgi:hypothetical protein